MKIEPGKNHDSAAYAKGLHKVKWCCILRKQCYSCDLHAEDREISEKSPLVSCRHFENSYYHQNVHPWSRTQDMWGQFLPLFMDLLHKFT